MHHKRLLTIVAVLLCAAAIITYAVPDYFNSDGQPKAKQYRQNTVGNVNFGPPRSQSTYWQFVDTNSVTITMTADTFTLTTNMGATAAGMPLPPGSALPLGYYQTSVVLNVVRSFAVQGVTLGFTMSSSYFCDQGAGAGSDTVAVFLSPPSGGPTKLFRCTNSQGGWPITGAPYAPYAARFNISDSGVSADTAVTKALAISGDSVSGRLANIMSLDGGAATTTMLCDQNLVLATLYKNVQSGGNWTITIRNLCSGALASNFVNSITLTLLGPTIQTSTSNVALKDTTPRANLEAQHSIVENGILVYKLTRSQSEQ